MTEWHEGGGLCFGGPMDGRIIEARQAVIRAAMPPRLSALKAEDVGPWSVNEYRIVGYTRQKVAWKGQTWQVWFADGYPSHRVVDQMNAIAGMCRMSWVWA